MSNTRIRKCLPRCGKGTRESLLRFMKITTNRAGMASLQQNVVSLYGKLYHLILDSDQWLHLKKWDKHRQKNQIKIKTQNRSDKIIIVIQRKWVLKERIYSKRTTPFLFLSIILGMAQVLKRQHENKARFVLENILAFFLWLKITTASWWRKLYISKSPVNQVCMCFHF